LDGIVFDIHWQGAQDENDEQVATQGFYMGNLDWNKNKYPNPEEMLANFKAKNVHSIAITEPYFAGSISNYQTLKEHGWLADESVNNMDWVFNPSGLIDASNPDAMEWMNGFYKARTEEGLDGWWLDLGEPERHDGDSHHMGGNFNQIHNEFGNLWIESTYNGLKKNFPNMRHFLMPRAGTAGMQRFSTFPWTGDIRRSWNGLAAQIPALVNGSMSGMGYLGSDIGGFTSTGTNPNLYLRWVQLGVFYPMMRTHSADQPEPYNSCYSSVVDKVREFIRLRYSYLPYTYTLSYKNTRYGSPIARPISFMDPDNASIANCMDEYLWGPDILVAPVVSENATSRNITFPKGGWADLNDGKIYEGTANYAAPLDRLPHFLREGAMVPRYMDSDYTSTANLNPDNIEVEFFPYRNNTDLMTAEMYEDDHVTPDPISTGDYHLTKFSALSNEYGVAVMIEHEGTRHFKPESMTSNQADVRQYVFHIYGHEAQQEVSVIRYPAANTMARASEQSTPLSNHGNKDAFDNSDEDGYYVADNTTHVRVSASPLETLLLSSGDAALVTGVTGTESINYLWLAYADGTINYSA
ncbi:glycoside hydrolase family 31 protein, partial [uncultured Duncaniella sp.]|uniref:glycoside hydrolase family 31 protein n=1 Tax=uncultured Duncaniella sp. TaxID=2768039 RepID=UPI002666E3E3